MSLRSKMFLLINTLEPFFKNKFCNLQKYNTGNAVYKIQISLTHKISATIERIAKQLDAQLQLFIHRRSLKKRV